MSRMARQSIGRVVRSAMGVGERQVCVGEMRGMGERESDAEKARKALSSLAGGTSERPPGWRREGASEQ